MRRSLKKLIVLVSAIVMMFAMSITAFADNGNTIVKSIKIKGENNTKAITTLYVNGDADEVDEVYLAAKGKDATPASATYDLVFTGKENGKTIVKNLVVVPKNRAIATAKIQKTGDKEQLVVTAQGVGKTTITVKDKRSGKSAKINVTVKALVDTLNFGAATETDELTGAEYVRVERGGKVNLLVSTNADASNKKVKYVVLENEVLINGKWQDSLNNKKKAQAVVKVDGKGNATGIAEKRAGVEMARAKVLVYALDQKAVKEDGKKVTSGVYNEITVYVYPATYEKNDIIQFTNLKLKKANAKLGKSNTYAPQTLYTNTSDAAHTLKVVAAAYKKADDKYVKCNQKVTYTTSNAKVATVSADGVVTAVGNGKATISAVPAYGFTAPKATVQVTVKTKPDAISVTADELSVAVGKSVKIKASVAKTASYKKLAYEVIEGKDVVATVNKSGSVKGIAEGTAKVKVSTIATEEFPSVSRIVTVKVANLVDKVTLTDMSGNAVPKSVTIYDYNKYSLATSAPQSYTFKANVTGKNGLTPTDSSVYTGSSKWAVAGVDNYGDSISVYANGKGSAKITVTAEDGSKKKASLNVKVISLVDEINVTNAYTSDWVENEATGIWEEVLTLNVVKGQKTTIKAAANADASNKKLAEPTIVGTVSENAIVLDKWNVTIPESQTEDIVLEIKATDGVGESAPFTQKLILHPVDDVKYADANSVWVRDQWAGDVAVDYNDRDDVTAITMKKGDSVTLYADFAGDVVDRTAKWTLAKGSKGIAVKNGVVTAKSVTDGATVVLTYNTSATTTATKEVKVCVVQSDAEYQKALNKQISTNLKAEDRSYLGAKVAFNEKGNYFDVQITDPSVEIAGQKDTGIMSILTDLVDANTSRIVLENWANGKEYHFDRLEGTQICVAKGTTVYNEEYGDYEFVAESTTNVDGFDAIGDYLKADLAAEGYATLKAFNGVSAELTVYSQNAKEGYPALENDASYCAYFYINGNYMEGMLDARIQSELEELNAFLAVENIASVDYDAAKNVATVNINDNTVTVEEAELSAKARVITALKAIYEEVEEASVSVQVGELINNSKSFSKDAGDDLDNKIEELFAEVKEQAGAETALAQFEGGSAVARVLYRFGNNGYRYDYTVNFVRTTAAVDAQVDDRIAANMATVNVEGSGIKPEYNAATNALTVKVNKPGFEVLTLNNTGLFEAFANTLKDVAVVNKKVTAVIATADKQTEIADVAKITKADLVDAFGLFDDIKLSDLLDDNAVITIVYPQLTGNVTVSYTINYVLDMTSICADIDAAIATALADVKAKDAVIAAETSYAGHAFNVVFDAKNDKTLFEAREALYDLVKAAVPEEAVAATFAATTDAGEYLKKFEAATVTMEDVEEIFSDATGLTALDKVSALAGNEVTIKVDYDKEGTEYSVIYTVSFSVKEAPVEEESSEETSSEAAEDVATVEETEEETTEETTEEVEASVEETTEEVEVVEETAEETVEETTEIAE